MQSIPHRRGNASEPYGSEAFHSVAAVRLIPASAVASRRILPHKKWDLSLIQASLVQRTVTRLTASSVQVNSVRS
jgi:hypothetical protein